MPERDGYKTLDLVVEDCDVPQNRVKNAIRALDIQPRMFQSDQRYRFYSPEDIAKIKEWLKTH